MKRTIDRIKRMEFKLSKEELNRIRTESRKLFKTASEFVRNCVQEYFQRNKN